MVSSPPDASDLIRFTSKFCDEEEEEVAALAKGCEDCNFTLLKSSGTFSDMPVTKKGLGIRSNQLVEQRCRVGTK